MYTDGDITSNLLSGIENAGGTLAKRWCMRSEIGYYSIIPPTSVDICIVCHSWGSGAATWEEWPASLAPSSTEKEMLVCRRGIKSPLPHPHFRAAMIYPLTMLPQSALH